MERWHGMCHDTVSGERIRQTKHRLAWKIPDDLTLRAHELQQPGSGPVSSSRLRVCFFILP